MKYALIGEKLGHSYSRVIHEKYFKYLNLNSTYDLIEIPKGNLAQDISSLINNGYIGFNVTIPYKIDVMNMCSNVLDEALKIGSVNTVKVQNGKMCGYNTDYHGLKLALEYNKIDIKNKSIVILGTGGASRAVQTLCKDLACSDITVVSRNPHPLSDVKMVSYQNISGGDVIINTTPVGMYPNTDASPFDNFDMFETAVDLIYNPSDTLFLRNAHKKYLKTVNGLYMLVAQAIYSQSIWNETKVDFEIINKIYDEMRGELK